MTDAKHNNIVALNVEDHAIITDAHMGEHEMSDLKKYIAKRKKTDKEFKEGFEEGYEQLKLSATSYGGSSIR